MRAELRSRPRLRKRSAARVALSAVNMSRYPPGSGSQQEATPWSIRGTAARRQASRWSGASAELRHTHQVRGHERPRPASRCRSAARGPTRHGRRQRPAGTISASRAVSSGTSSKLASSCALGMCTIAWSMPIAASAANRSTAWSTVWVPSRPSRDNERLPSVVRSMVVVVAAERLAVPAKHVELVGDHVEGHLEDVARVGVLRDQAQALLLAAAADQDPRPRRADRRGGVERPVEPVVPALERRARRRRTSGWRSAASPRAARSARSAAGRRPRARGAPPRSTRHRCRGRRGRRRARRGW